MSVHDAILIVALSILLLGVFLGVVHAERSLCSRIMTIWV